MVTNKRSEDYYPPIEFPQLLVKPVNAMNVVDQNLRLFLKNSFNKDLLKIGHLLWLMLCFAATANAQQEPQYTNYLFNTLAYNPAYAGSKGYLSVRALHRDQWYDWGGVSGPSGYDGRPVTQTFTAHTGLGDRIGVGISFINDRIGAKGSTGLDLSYAYRVDFGQGIIALGLQGGIINWRADWDELDFKDPQQIDNSFNEGNPNLWIPNFGAGIYYYNENFYAGISVPRLTGIRLRDNVDESVIRRWAQIYQHFYLTLGGTIPLKGDNIIFKPSLLIKSVGLFADFLRQGDSFRTVGAPTSFDVNASFLLHQKLWLGASFRSAFEAFRRKQNDITNTNVSSHASADVLLGYQMAQGLRIGVAYDFPLSAINNYSTGSIEVMLGWDFVRKIDKIVTPRYFF